MKDTLRNIIGELEKYNIINVAASNCVYEIDESERYNEDELVYNTFGEEFFESVEKAENKNPKYKFGYVVDKVDNDDAVIFYVYDFMYEIAADEYYNNHKQMYDKLDEMYYEWKKEEEERMRRKH